MAYVDGLSGTRIPKEGAVMGTTHAGCGGEAFEVMLVPRAFAIEAFTQDGVTYFEEAGEVPGVDVSGLADQEHVSYWCCRCKHAIAEGELDSGL